MEDRQPRYPGRVIFTRSDNGESIQGVLEMDDDPEKEGTPPIKPNLFDDTTQARYPAGVDTVNLALRETVLLSDKATDAEAAAGTDDSKWMTPKKVQQAVGDKVGDIKITRRTDLGNKYLLCNGTKFDDTEYPDLIPYATLKSMYSITGIKQITSSSTDVIYGVTYGNGYYVAYGGSQNSNDKTLPTIWYTTNPMNSWIKKILSTTTSADSTYPITDVKYVNSTWLALMGDGSGWGGFATMRNRLWTAYSPNENWTLRVDEAGAGNSNTFKIIAHNPVTGECAFCGSSTSSSNTIWYTTNPTGSWNQSVVSGLYGSNFKCVNGYWMSIVESGSYRYVWVYYSNRPEGPYTQANLFLTDTTSSVLQCFDMEYIDGKYVFFGRRSDKNNTPWAVYTTSLVAGSSNISGQVQLSDTPGIIYCHAIKDNGDIVLYLIGDGYPCIIHSSNLLNGWITVKLSGTYTGKKLSNISVQNDVLVVPSGSTYALVGDGGYYLPTITISNAYCYIRGKN